MGDANPPTMVTPTDLKYCSDFRATSEVLVRTVVPTGADPRQYYLSNVSQCKPPCVSSSDFVPNFMVEHLMRNKKDSAISVKFQANNSPPDAITNMEGAMHTYVTPIVLANIHGDYKFDHGHRMITFPAKGGFEIARRVIVSCAIHPDFENDEVMVSLASLEEKAIRGKILPPDFQILDIISKQDDVKRQAYDKTLKLHLIAHLVHDGYMPGLLEATSSAMSELMTISYLEKLITDPAPLPLETLQSKYVYLLRGRILSLELLYNSAAHQLRNELSALELLCPQGYIYTYDPPSIFARELNAKIINRLFILALKFLSQQCRLRHMRVFAFNDFADKNAVDLTTKALRHQELVLVVDKTKLFRGLGGAYSPLAGTGRAILVLHNNSDAFGQNIESETALGSMDGAIGGYSSAAASLHRTREDLLRFQI